MISKREALRRSRLCVILDREVLKTSPAILRTAKLSLAGGADFIQLRDKRGEARDVARLAKAVKALAGKYHAIFIVNDRIEAAIASSADGIHIGQGDIDITLARRLLGRRKMIGLSVSNLTQAVKAMGDHPDYLGVGPVFKTPIKSDIRAKGIELLAKVKKLSTPLFAIGGINLKNIGSIKAAGVKRSAVIRAVCAARDPLREAAALRKALQ